MAGCRFGRGNRQIPAAAGKDGGETGDFSGIYKAALDYLDAAGSEEKASAAWSAQREAVLKGTKPTDHGYRQQDYDRISAIR